MIKHAAWLFAIVLALSAGPAFAGGADLSGNVSFQVSGGNVNIKIDRISNNTATYTTGTLYVTLFFSESSSVYSSGYDVAQQSLAFIDGTGQLSPGEYYQGIELNVPYSRPPDGTYYAYVFVSEWPNLNTVLDYIAFTNTVTVGNGDPGGGYIEMRGQLSFQTRSDGTVNLRVEEIRNLSSSRTSGTLYLTLRMSTGHDPTTTGYNVARQSLSFIGSNGTLPPNHSFTGISVYPDFSPPPNGTYWVHLYVSEWPDLNTALDVFTFDQTVTFGPAEQTPARPNLSTATNGSYTDRVHLDWTAVSGATSYEIYRSTSAGSNGSLIEVTSATSYNDYSAAQGVTYYYRLRACNNAGCSGFSDYNSGWRASSSPPPSKPDKPVNFTVTRGTRPDVLIDWEGVPNTTKYKVFRSDCKKCKRHKIGTVRMWKRSATTDFHDSNANPGQVYWYRLKACNDAGCSRATRARRGWSY